MKKSISLLLAAAMAASALVGCGSSSTSATTAETAAEATTAAAGESAAETTVAAAADAKDIDVLNVAFVPSREPDEIVTATEPLKEMIKKEMAPLGYNIKDVNITVGTSFEAVGEGLAAGTIDVGFIPGNTYILYDDDAEVLLTATRDGLSIDSDSAKDWNDQKPTKPTENQVTFYRALIVAGPSEAGKAVADKVNNGEELTWEDLDGLNWGVMGPTSPAGYVYPALWIQKNFGKNITDLTHVVECDSYGTAFARLAQGQIDVLCTYADARRDYEEKWNADYAMQNSVWDDTNVIGVTEGIYNDTISGSKVSTVMMDEDFKAAFKQAMINIGNTEEGKEVIAIYSHKGYVEANDSDYDSARDAQDLIKALRLGQN
ncbi:phosphate/phosphite/phosphonate ABC transporter substrate-binding protein [Oribacterium sp. WCC10]|uniref:phosphate/phosphite/phosphonate ABC transporter substrate-binding protein n=1 Tax=Oribacterium sp. WCC10 TaxID=1855343 RepID=UPI0008E1F17D|nr:PhnD/SsuA/transferrin family substrate-binding protein [Oribacterium sp. WCC10]SFG13285.1 phosphonate transport system substrate-binding protein [Oribacterium sp. WCC10]